MCSSWDLPVPVRLYHILYTHPLLVFCSDSPFSLNEAKSWNNRDSEAKNICNDCWMSPGRRQWRQWQRWHGCQHWLSLMSDTSDALFLIIDPESELHSWLPSDHVITRNTAITLRGSKGVIDWKTTEKVIESL